MRPAFAHGFWLGGGLAGAMTASFGHFPRRDYILERDAEQDLITTGRAKYYPPADGKLTFDKLSSVFASGNKTRDDQPDHIVIDRLVPRDIAEMWVRMCPAQVYELRRARRRQGAGADDPFELRPVRRDHGQGRPADPARGRLRARVLAVLGFLRAFYVPPDGGLTVGADSSVSPRLMEVNRCA